MRFEETFSADCKTSTIVLSHKPHCNGRATLTAFDPATGRATYVHKVKDHVKGHSSTNELTWHLRGERAREVILGHTDGKPVRYELVTNT